MALFTSAPDPKIQAEAEAHRADPPRVIVGSFAALDLAHEALQELYKDGFSPHEAAVVADNLVFESNFTGHFGSLNKALKRSGNGMVVGGVLGIGFGLTSFLTPVVSALALAFYLIVFGGVVGLAVSLFDYMFVVRKRAFEAHNGVYAEQYSVLVVESRAEDARQALTS